MKSGESRQLERQSEEAGPLADQRMALGAAITRLGEDVKYLEDVKASHRYVFGQKLEA